MFPSHLAFVEAWLTGCTPKFKAVFLILDSREQRKKRLDFFMECIKNESMQLLSLLLLLLLRRMLGLMTLAKVMEKKAVEATPLKMQTSWQN